MEEDWGPQVWETIDTVPYAFRLCGRCSVLVEVNEMGSHREARCEVLAATRKVREAAEAKVLGR